MFNFDLQNNFLALTHPICGYLQLYADPYVKLTRSEGFTILLSSEKVRVRIPDVIYLEKQI